MVRKLLDRQNAKWALVSKENAPNNKLAIFIHGFGGSHLSTWGTLAQHLEATADGDAILRDWDYLFIGYDTWAVHTYLDIAKNISREWNAAQSGVSPFPHKYERVALFGHSLGTLGIRQYLCALSEQSKGTMKALHSVNLIGTPLNGSWLAHIAVLKRAKAAVSGNLKALASYPIYDALKPNNPQIRMLQAWNTALHHYPIADLPSPEVSLGDDDWVVGNSDLLASGWRGDKAFTQYHSDHLTLPTHSGTQSDMLTILQKGLQ